MLFMYSYIYENFNSPNYGAILALSVVWGNEAHGNDFGPW